MIGAAASIGTVVSVASKFSSQHMFRVVVLESSGTLLYLQGRLCESTGTNVGTQICRVVSAVEHV